MKLILAHSILLGTTLTSCSPTEPNELDRMGLTAVTSKSLIVHAWIADESDERQKGLMFVTAEEMARLPDGRERGMVFLFQGDQATGFWMRNTIIDLDIAFIQSDGVIVDTFTMTALDESLYTPRSAYRYALEVNAGVLGAHGIGRGDRVDIAPVSAKRP